MNKSTKEFQEKDYGIVTTTKSQREDKVTVHTEMKGIKRKHNGATQQQLRIQFLI